MVTRLFARREWHRALPCTWAMHNIAHISAKIDRHERLEEWSAGFVREVKACLKNDQDCRPLRLRLRLPDDVMCL